MSSLIELRQKQRKELELFDLKQAYNTVFEYQDMMILSIIYGIVETIAIEKLYLVFMKMLEQEPIRYSGGYAYPINYPELIKAIEKLTIHIVGDLDKHYKVRFINCDKTLGFNFNKVEGNLWIRTKVMDPIFREKQMAQLAILIERGDVE